MGSEVRVALILGGGVSLGSFSGGALAEVLRLLEGYPGERRAGGVTKPLVPKIDVVTGASAGSMTLAILLRLLLDGRTAEEIQDAMRAAWVEGVGIDTADGDGQLLPDLRRHSAPSFLSKRPIEHLADRYLGGNRATNPPRAAPSPLLADTVYASFAVANLHGIDVRAPAQMIRQRSAGTGEDTAFADLLTTTFHDDRVRFRLDAAEPPADEVAVDAESGAIRLGGRNGIPGAPAAEPWRLFRAAAIASGSFPGAFPPVSLLRRREEYGRLWPDDLARGIGNLEPVDAFRFAYVDGGTFRNEPLREAIELAALRDAGHDARGVERIFLFVDPHVSGSSQVRALDFEHAVALHAQVDADGRVEKHELERRDYAGRLLSVLARVAGMLRGQSAFRDWLRAAKLNSRVDWQAELEPILRDLCRDHPRGGELLGAARRMLERIYQEKLARAPARAGAAASEARRRREADLEGVAAELGPDANELARTLVLALRNAAGLRRKRHLNLVAITPWSVPDPPIPLAGNFLANFGGFLREGWREHDFDAGRFVAHRVLTLPIGAGVERLIRSDVEEPVTREQLAGRLRRDPIFLDAEEAVRDRFLGAARAHLENLAHALGVPHVLDDLLSRFARRRLAKALRQPAVTSRYVVVRIQGAVASDHELERGPTGATARPVEVGGGARVLETVIELRAQPELPEAERHELVGPHVLHEAGEPPQLRVRSDVTRRDELKLKLEGSPKHWFETAARRRFLVVEWRGGPEERVFRPSDLVSSPPERE